MEKFLDKVSNNYSNHVIDILKFFNSIRLLPDEIKKKIIEYLSFKSLLWVNKDYYTKYHFILTSKMLRKNCQEESYIRNIIKRDHHFVFEINIKEKIKKWLSIKKVIYNYIIYNNYLYFLINFCIDNESQKCKQILIQHMKKEGLYENIKNKKLCKFIHQKK